MSRVGLTPNIFCYDTVISAVCMDNIGAQWKIGRGLLREQVGPRLLLLLVVVVVVVAVFVVDCCRSRCRLFCVVVFLVT